MNNRRYLGCFIITALIILNTANASKENFMTTELTGLARAPFVIFNDEMYSDHYNLRNQAQEVPLPLSAEHKAIAIGLKDRMINEKNCIGLAAPLLGLPWRIIVVRVFPELKELRSDVDMLIEPTIIINPAFKPLDDVQQAGWEGSVSFKDRMGKVRRYHNVCYEGWDVNGQPVTGMASGLLARVIQHEIDYLNGQCFIDLFEDDLPHGTIHEMTTLRDQELINSRNMNLLQSPYVTIDDETCADRHILRDRAHEVPLPLSAEHKAIAEGLMDRMINQDKCVGLAAPQVGIPLRIIAVQVAAKLKAYRTDVDTLTDPMILINPSYELLDEDQRANWEGCFSIRKQMGKIRRYHNIRYQGWGANGQPITGMASGLLARVIQHEIDHLNGQLIIDLFEDDLVHGPLDDMIALRTEEFKEYKKMTSTKLPYVAIDDENCHNRHVLQQPAEQVPLPLSLEHKQIANNLLTQMINQDNCVGLAAPQVGIALCIIAVKIDVDEDLEKYRPDCGQTIKPFVLINPRYKPLDDTQHVDWEACFSVNNSMGQIRRYKNIEYTGWDIDGNEITGVAHDFFARVMQHEIDHVNGCLIIDRFEKDLHHGPKEKMREIWQASLNR